jgi:putative N6-adenine-specific DNA methylase
LESIAAAELEALGITSRVEAGGGGATWKGSPSSVALANLWLRTASRVIVRIAEFRARTFFELERHTRRIDWDRFVAHGTAVRFRVTCRKSRLYHSDAVAQRFAEAVAVHSGSARAQSDASGDDEDADETAAAPSQLFVVRFNHDVCTVSADTSGALLHRRGYRQAVAKAPLRETLAAAMLHAAGWRGDRPLVDPLCGSGTIPIEAALIARRIPPGLRRDFAFTRWPDHNETRWQELRAHATDRVLHRSPVPIAGSDRDVGAIDAAQANATRAGVDGDTEFAVAALSAAEPRGLRGAIVTNPPYGVRVRGGGGGGGGGGVGGEKTGDLRDLYARLGTVARNRFGGWTLAVLSAGRQMDAQLAVPLEEVLKTTNGGIPVHLVVSQLPVVDAERPPV